MSPELEEHFSLSSGNIDSLEGNSANHSNILHECVSDVVRRMEENYFNYGQVLRDYKQK